MFELLIVITISGILAAIGTASFKYLTTSNRASTEINGLLNDLQYARSEAQKQAPANSEIPVREAQVPALWNHPADPSVP